ncbi:MAG: transposase [Oscillospiraceae bacterium]|nr:transposase [Oscillospiraceae bacterium]
MEYQKRKRPRLKQYDYSLPGYYYVTIHTEKNTPHLSNVQTGGAFHRASVHLTELGKIAQQQLLLLEKRYAHVKMDKYVIMPTHIHAIIRLTEGTAGASPRPTVPDVIGAYKSLTTRACNQAFCTPGRKLFQTSFYDMVLRNETAYQECWRYIDENPEKWLLNPEDI